MEFQEAVRRQRMTREFDPRPVPRDVLESIFRNAQKAPSAGFSQGFAFVVLEDAALERFWQLTEGGVDATFSRAPVVILPLANKQAYLERYSGPDKAGLGFDREENWPAPYWIIDTAFASMIVLLSATSLGLGVWLFTMIQGVREVLDGLGVPAEFEPIGAIAVGYPAGDLERTSLRSRRKPLEDVVHWGRW